MPQQSSRFGRLVEFYAKKIDQVERHNTIKEVQQNSNQRGSGRGNDSWTRTSKNQLFRSEFKLQNGVNATSDDDSVIAATVEGFLQPPSGSVYEEQGGKCRFRIKLDYTYNPASKARSSLSSLNGLSLDSLAEALQVDRSNLPEDYQLDILSKLKPMLHGLTEVLSGESGMYACPRGLPESRGSVSPSVMPAKKSIPAHLSIGMPKKSAASLALHQAALNETANGTVEKTYEVEDQPSTVAAKGMHRAFGGANIDPTKSADAYALTAEISTLPEQSSGEVGTSNLTEVVKPLTSSIVTSAVQFLVLEDVVKSRQSAQERFRASRASNVQQDGPLTNGKKRSTSARANQQSLASQGTTEEIIIADDYFAGEDEEEVTKEVNATIECSRTDVAITGPLSIPGLNAVGGAPLNKNWLHDIGFDEDSTIGGLDVSWSTLESVGVISIATLSSKNPVTAINKESNDDSLLVQVETAKKDTPERLSRRDFPSNSPGLLEQRKTTGTVGFFDVPAGKPSVTGNASSVVRPDDILFNLHMDSSGPSREKSSVNVGLSMNFGRPGSLMSPQQDPNEAPIGYSLDSALAARDRISFDPQKRVSGASALGGPEEFDGSEYPRQNQPSINSTNTKARSLSLPDGPSAVRSSSRSGGSQVVPAERSHTSSRWSGGPAVTSVMVRTVIPAPSWAVNTEDTDGLNRTSSKVTLPVVLQDQGERVSQRPTTNSIVPTITTTSPVMRGSQQEVDVEALGVPHSSVISHPGGRGSAGVTAEVTSHRGTNGQTEVVTLTFNEQPPEYYDNPNDPPRETVEELKEPPNPLVKLMMPPITAGHPESRHYLDQANAMYYELSPMDSVVDDINAVYVVQTDDARTTKLSVKVPPPSEAKPSLKRTDTPWASTMSPAAHSIHDEIEAAELDSPRPSEGAAARQRSTLSTSFKPASRDSKAASVSSQSKGTRTTKLALAVSTVSDGKPGLRRRGTPWTSQLLSSEDDVQETGATGQPQVLRPERTSQVSGRGREKGSPAAPQERASSNRHNLLPVPVPQAPPPAPSKRSTGSQVTPQSNNKLHNTQCIHNVRRGVNAVCQQCRCGPVVRRCETYRWSPGTFARLPPPAVPTNGSPVRRPCRPIDILGRHHGYCCQLPVDPAVRQKCVYTSDVRLKGANVSGSCGLYQAERVPLQSNNEAHQCSAHDGLAEVVGQRDITDKTSSHFVTKIALNTETPTGMSRFVWRRCPGPWARGGSGQGTTHMGGDGAE
ncbi:hypothetical protein SprV_0301071600 [Sparganum proliferum]